MKIAQESIFSTSIRSFFVGLCTVLGIGAGIIPVVLLISFLASSGQREIPATHQPKVLTNHDETRRPFDHVSPLILQINIEGPIGGPALNTSKIKNLLQESTEGSFKKGRIKAILLRINSPGGSVLDSDGIYRAIKHYKEKHNIPVYAYVDGMAASGGIYVAAAADKIYSGPAGLVGSVGVTSLMPFINISEPLERFGIKTKTITAGKGKDMMNPTRPWKEGEETVIQDITNYFYDLFVDIISSSRPKIDREKLISEYGAKVFSAKEAEDYGFLDGSNLSREEALYELIVAAGLEKKDYQVVELQPQAWVSNLFGEQSPFENRTIKHELQLSPSIEHGLEKAQSMFLAQ